MADSVHVEVPRVLDRDRLLEALSAAGHEGRSVDDDEHVAVEVPCGGDSAAACSELLAHVEALVSQLDVPFVPTLGDGVVYLRPPGS